MHYHEITFCPLVNNRAPTGWWVQDPPPATECGPVKGVFVLKQIVCVLCFHYIMKLLIAAVVD